MFYSLKYIQPNVYSFISPNLENLVQINYQDMNEKQIYQNIDNFIINMKVRGSIITKEIEEIYTLALKFLKNV